MMRPLTFEVERGSSPRRRTHGRHPALAAAILALSTWLLGWEAPARAAQDAAGFPVKLPALITSPLALGKGANAMPRLYFTVGGDSLTCVTAAGKICEGFPLSLGKDAAIVGAPSIADLDGDGGDEIAVLLTSGPLRVYRADGSTFASLDRGGEAAPLTSPTLADLDGDARAELIFADAAGKLHALDARGRPMAGFPRTLRSPATSSVSWAFPGAGGARALFWGSEDGRLDAMFADGSAVPGFPVATGYLISAQPALADLEGGGELAIAFASQDFKIYAADLQGAPLPGFPIDTGARLKEGPALARLESAPRLSIVVAAADGRLHVIDGAGKPRAGFPKTLADRLVGAPLAVDLDGDDRDELLVTAADGRLHVLRANARPFPGFPAQLKGLPDAGPLAFAWEGAVLVAQGAGETLHAFRVRPRSSSGRPPSWPMAGHDSARSGRVWPNAPIYRDIALSQERPAVTDPVELSYRFVDLDGRPEPPLAVRWLRDGKAVPEAEGRRVLPAGMARKGERWTAQIAHASARVLGQPSFQVRNTPPSPPRIALSPETPTRQGGVRAAIAEPALDPDGEAPTYTYRWFIDGQRVPRIKGEEIGPGVLERGAQLAVEVVASDGEEASDPVRVEAIVGNSRPGAPTTRLGTKSPKCGEEIEIVIDRPALDADGDPIAYRASLSIGGRPLQLTRDRTRVPTSLARKGDALAIDVVAFDGTEEGDPVQLEATVANCPPSPPRAAIAPRLPVTGDAIEARLDEPSTDWDGDPVSYRFTFFRDGKPVGDRVAHAKKGERYELEVVASDGTAQVKGKRAVVLVGNTPPGPPTLAWQAESPRAGDRLGVRVVAPSTDRDGDAVRYRHAWRRDGVPVPGQDGPTLTGAIATRKGERWEVAVTPFDGMDEGLAARLAIVIANTPPLAPQIALSPAAPGEAEAVRAVVTQRAMDADGDEVSYRYRWLIDGLEQDLPPSTAALPAGRLAGTRRLLLIATPFDGTDEGVPARAEAEIQPRPVEAPRVSLAPERPTLEDTVECRVEGVAGDEMAALSFEWFLDGRPLGLGPATTRMSAARARAGQSIRCAATRHAGGGSARGESPVATVSNVAPTEPRIAIEPREPRSGDDLFCRIETPARDLNGGAVRYDYRWTEDGAPIKPVADAPWRLKARDLRRGPVYRCEVTALNESGASPKATAERRYANSLPSAPRVRLTPEAPRSSDGLTCELAEEARDPDGDALSYRFVWWKNGVEQPLSPATQRIPARMTRPNERWRCGAEASDGEGAGPRHRSIEVRLGP